MCVCMCVRACVRVCVCARAVCVRACVRVNPKANSFVCLYVPPERVRLTGLSRRSLPPWCSAMGDITLFRFFSSSIVYEKFMRRRPRKHTMGTFTLPSLASSSCSWGFRLVHFFSPSLSLIGFQGLRCTMVVTSQMTDSAGNV